MIDAYHIFRERPYIKWWNIYNYRSIDWNYAGLHDYVKKQQPSFIDATTDPFTETELVSMVEKHQLHTLAPILVPDLELAKRYRHLNFLFYPLWLVSAIHRQQIESCTIETQRNQQLSCLNRQPRFHRFLTYYELTKQPWFDQVFISFAGLDHSLGGIGDVTDINQLYVLGADVVNYFKEHAVDFPKTSETTYDWRNCHSPNSTAYTNCWANLATETSVHTFCITEKTTKPLTSGCIFFPVASAGFIKTLKLIGFDLDIDGVDYTFDSELNWTARVKMCIEEINKVYNDLPDIWVANKSRLQYNHEYFRSDRLMEYCLQDVKEYV